MTIEDKKAYLEEVHCAFAKEITDGLVEALESLADTDSDGEISCEEFNAAYFDISDILEKHCPPASNSGAEQGGDAASNSGAFVAVNVPSISFMMAAIATVVFGNT